MIRTALALALVPHAALAASVTVSPGDDLGALTASLLAGDVVTFNDGTYELTATVYWSGQGTAEQPIVLEAAAGATPVLQLSSGSWVADLSNSAYVEIRGLTFQGAADWQEHNYGGLRLSGDLNTDITIEGNVFRDLMSTGIAIYSNAQYLTIRDNLIRDLGAGTGMYIGCSEVSCWMQDSTIEWNHIHSLVGEYANGIVLLNGCHDNTVRDNVIHDVGLRGVYLGSAEYSPPNVLEGNAIWGVLGEGVRVEGAAVVRNNLVFEVASYGIRSNNNSRDALENVVIAHNTVASSGDYGLYLNGWANRTGMVLANNVVANPTGLAFQYQSGEVDTVNVVEGNVLSGLVSGVDPEVYQGWYLPGGGFTDFADAEHRSYYPTVASTLRDAGVDGSWVPELDFNGLERDDLAPDVGAYEWVGADNPGWIVGEDFKEPVDEDPDGNGDEEPSGCCSGDDDEPVDAVLLLPLWGVVWGLRRSRRTPRTRGRQR